MAFIIFFRITFAFRLVMDRNSLPLFTIYITRGIIYYFFSVFCYRTTLGLLEKKSFIPFTKLFFITYQFISIYINLYQFISIFKNLLLYIHFYINCINYYIYQFGYKIV